MRSSLLTTTVALALVLMAPETPAQNPSPCPEVFEYEPRGKENDRWYGVVSLRTQEDLSGVWVHVTLDRPAELLGNWFGEATSSDNQEYIIKNPKYHLEAGPPVSLRFFVKYNAASTIPSLTTVRLNGKTICGTSTSSTGRPQLHISQVKPSNNQNNNNYETNNGQRGNSGTTHVGVTNGRPTRNKVRTSTSSYQGIGETNYENDRVTRPISTNSNSNNRPASSSNNFGSYGTSNGLSSNTAIDRVDSTNKHNVDETYLTISSSSDSLYPNNNVERPSRPSRPSNNGHRPSTSSSSSSSSSSSGTGSSSGNVNFGSSSSREPVYGSDSNLGTVGTGLGHTGGHTTSTDDYDFFPGDFALSLPVNRPITVRPSILQSKRPACGTVAMRPSPLITYGQNTSEGQWPWHAALYHSQGIQLTYTCGASLISEDYVITAAHCVTKPQTNRAINPQNLLVYLGKHNLKKFGTHVQDIEVEKISVHPYYNSSVFHNDIAILKLGHSAEITNYVRPVCLWEENTDLNGILDRLGTVVGWGFDQDRKITSDLMQANMPIVQSLDCVYSNPDFFSRFTFDKSYCAGFRNGTSVCNGDSGGGMVFPKASTSGHSTVWQLRGLVSVGVALQGQTVCDTTHYIVFTDVAKHLDWIHSIINS